MFRTWSLVHKIDYLMVHVFAYNSSFIVEASEKSWGNVVLIFLSFQNRFAANYIHDLAMF